MYSDKETKSIKFYQIKSISILFFPTNNHTQTFHVMADLLNFSKKHKSQKRDFKFRIEIKSLF